MLQLLKAANGTFETSTDVHYVAAFGENCTLGAPANVPSIYTPGGYRYLPLEEPEAPAATSIQNNSSLSQRLSGSRVGTLGSVSGDPPAASTGKRTEIMMHPLLPGPRPLAVPGIGFPQNISIGSDVLDSRPFADLSGDHCGAVTRPPDRIVWLPLPRPWFAVHS